MYVVLCTYAVSFMILAKSPRLVGPANKVVARFMKLFFALS